MVTKRLRNLWILWKTQDSRLWNLWTTLPGPLFAHNPLAIISRTRRGSSVALAGFDICRLAHDTDRSSSANAIRGPTEGLPGVRRAPRRIGTLPSMFGAHCRDILGDTVSTAAESVFRGRLARNGVVVGLPEGFSPDVETPVENSRNPWSRVLGQEKSVEGQTGALWPELEFFRICHLAPLWKRLCTNRPIWKVGGE